MLPLPLDLREQARVLDRDADVGGDRGEQAHVGLVEPPLLAVLWTLITPIALSPSEDRHAEIRLRGCSDRACPSYSSSD